jgi:outer membrane immunogenic protein
MRRCLSILLAGVACTIASAQFASAADLPVKAPIYKAPAVIPFSWTGCYLGAHIGYGWGQKHDTDNLASDWFLGQPVDVDTDGVLGGGQVGCNYQFTSNFVIGIEGTLSAAGLDGSTTVTSPPVSVVAHVKTDWLATLAARLGYSFDRSLLYVKGGAAWAHDKYSGDWTFGVVGVNGISGSVSATETRTGWLIGVGWEYAFTNNWSAKVEYDYMNFGTKAVSFPVSPPGFGTYIGDIEQKIQTITVGINYRF